MTQNRTDIRARVEGLKRLTKINSATFKQFSAEYTCFPLWFEKFNENKGALFTDTSAKNFFVDLLLYYLEHKNEVIEKKLASIPGKLVEILNLLKRVDIAKEYQSIISEDNAKKLKNKLVDTESTCITVDSLGKNNAIFQQVIFPYIFSLLPKSSSFERALQPYLDPNSSSYPSMPKELGSGASNENLPMPQQKGAANAQQILFGPQSTSSVWLILLIVGIVILLSGAAAITTGIVVGVAAAIYAGAAGAFAGLIVSSVGVSLRYLAPNAQKFSSLVIPPIPTKKFTSSATSSLLPSVTPVALPLLTLPNTTTPSSLQDNANATDANNTQSFDKK
jgi:hypothetical protein